MKKCENCREEYEPDRCNHTRQKFCCVKCSKQRWYQEHRIETNKKGKKYYQEHKKKLEKRMCKWCGKEFMPSRSDNIFCCKRCGKQKCLQNPKLKERANERSKRYYRKHKEEIKQKGKIYRQGEKYKVRKRKYLLKNRKKIKNKKAKYRQRPEVKKRRNMQHSIPKNKLNDNIGGAIRKSLKGKKNGRHWEDLVGYTLQELMEHLEKQFYLDHKISWKNYGSYWEIDHLKPKSSFHFESYEDKEFKECWALENLQPLEATKNRRKWKKHYFKGG